MLTRAVASMETGHFYFLLGVVSLVLEILAILGVFFIIKLTDLGSVNLFLTLIYIWSFMTSVLILGGIHVFMRGAVTFAHGMNDAISRKEDVATEVSPHPSAERAGSFQIAGLNFPIEEQGASSRRGFVLSLGIAFIIVALALLLLVLFL